MVFSSVTFLFYFLPLVPVLYWLSGKKGRNLLLLAASLFFYAWGEGIYLLLMLTSIAVNYGGGRLIGNGRSVSSRKGWLAGAILLNLLILGFFKYANFITDNINIVASIIDLPTINLTPVRLPIGISFFTFQALSYLIDVYQKKVAPQKNCINLALYISLFPQLIAGPIVRYHDIAEEIQSRSIRLDDLAQGIERFIFGLSKKLLLANPMGAVADQIFALPGSELTTPVAWLGGICYTLQIYFDFSGYSDMAIGLGRLFGFHFLENFNYPYISKSIREFWKRWHISLSSWFRDYVYIPLGGNRSGTFRTGANLVIVFFLCGLWHGAAWTFVIWGLYHGFFLVLERTPASTLLAKIWPPVRIIVTLLIVIIGWVLFRSESLHGAIQYLLTMAGQGVTADTNPISNYLDAKVQFELVMALLFALPVYPLISRLKTSLLNRMEGKTHLAIDGSLYFFKLTAMTALCYFSIISLAAGVYNPFIYFRF